MPAKTKGIAKRSIYNSFMGLVEGKIQFLVDLFVRIYEINRRRNYIIFDGKNSRNGFNRTCSPKQMTRHGLC